MTTYFEQMQKVFQSNNKTREYQVHSSKVHSVAWNCDGKKLASGSFDKTVVTFVLDRDRLTKDNSFRGHTDSVDQLRWHPSLPDLLVTASGDKTTRVWDARSRKAVAMITTKAVSMNPNMSHFDVNRLVGMRSTLDTAFNALLALAGTSEFQTSSSLRRRRRSGRGRHPRSFSITVTLVEAGTIKVDSNVLAESASFVSSSILKMTLETSSQEMENMIRSALPSLLGSYELLRCSAPPSWKLVLLAPDLNCPAKLKACKEIGRSALYVRPTSPPEPVSLPGSHRLYSPSVLTDVKTFKQTSEIQLISGRVAPSRQVKQTINRLQANRVRPQTRLVDKVFDNGPSTSQGENINVCWSPDGHTIAVGNKEDLVTFIDSRTFKARVEEQFKFEVNEISWNNDGDLFFLTSGNGSIHILSYPDLKLQHVLTAHPANCICIEFDPTGSYFATGSADALVSLWDVHELVCLRTLARLDWPVRTLSFSYDGRMLASASEDLIIDIADVETGEKITDVPCESPTFTVAWHPKRHLLAFACDDKDKYDRDRDSGTVKLFGLSDTRDL